nr:uncharacterized protein LOC129278845 [Lytechinus pictus]
MLKTSLSLPHTTFSKKKKGKPEWTPQVAKAYNTAQEARKSWQSDSGTKSGSLYDDHLNLKKAFRSCLRQARAIERRKLHKQVEQASVCDESLFYRLIKKSRGQKSQNTTTTCTLEYDECTYKDTEVILGWHKYFSDLASDSSHSSESNTDCSFPLSDDTHCDATRESSPLHGHLQTRLKYPDLQTAINSLKLNKASGPDSITTEHIKHLGTVARRFLLYILNLILQSGHCPKSLKTGIILPFHKGKGKSPLDPRNYRGITLTPTITYRPKTSYWKPVLNLVLRHSFPSVIFLISCSLDFARASPVS